MTVNANDTVERNVISGVGPYPYTFRIFAETELVVSALSTATPPAPTLLTYLTDYTVTGANVDTGGTVLLTSPAATTYAGYTLDVRSNTVQTQPTSIRNIGRFLPSIHEDAFDRLARQVQDIERRLKSTFRYPDNMQADGMLSPISGWLSKYLTVNAAGVLEAAALSSTAVTASVITSLLTSSTAEQDVLIALILARSDNVPVLDYLRRTAAEIAASVTPTNYAYEPGNLKRYGAVGDGVTNDRTALFTANLVGGLIKIPAGTYLINSATTIGPSSVLVFDKGAIIKPAAAIAVTINGPVIAGPYQIFDATNAGALINGTLRAPHIFFEWLGAAGDGTGSGAGTNDAVAIQKALKLAVDANYLPIRALAKTYRVDSTIHVNGDSTGSIYSPQIIGADMDKTIFDFTNLAAGQVCFMIKTPTSGHVINKDVLSLFRVQGHSTSIAVEFQGMCGAHVRSLSFYTCAEAVRFNNEAAATFTEYCSAENCYFATDTVLKARHKKNAGDSSQHGSGIGGRSVLATAGAATFIQIDSGVQPYNMLFDAQVFGTGGACTLFQNNSTLSVTVAGKLTWETGVQTLTLGAGSEVLFSGSVCGTGEFVTAGTFLQCDAAVLNTDNSTTALGARRAYPSKAITTGANTFTSVMPAQNRIMWLNLRATNYDYRYLITVENDGSGAAGATATIATLRSNNTAGYGAPAFTVNSSGNLVATQAGWPGSGVTALWYELAVSTGGIGAKNQRI